MEYKELRILINRYLEGLTDTREEEKIRSYFREYRDIPKDLESFRELFHFYGQQRGERSQLVFEDLKNTKVRHLHRSGAAKRRRFRVLAVAAGLLLLAGIFFIHQQEQGEKVYAVINGQPVTNQQKAYQETRRALQMVSSNFNHGTEDLQKLSKFHQTKELITKNQGL